VVGSQPQPIRTKLISSHSSAAPGSTVLVGTLFTIEDPWHIYWKNPGDIGLATKVNFSGNPLLDSSDLKWPLPKQFKQSGELLGYGYEREVLLFSEFQIPAQAKPGTEIEITADSSWLGCAPTLCLPGESKGKVSIVIGDNVKSAEDDLFEHYRIKLPRTAEGSDVRVAQESTASDSHRLVLSFPVEPEFVEWLPATPAKLKVSGIEVIKGRETTVSYSIAAKEGQSCDVKAIAGVVKYALPGGKEQGVSISAPAC
jgi:DsbC/DsbD-like thiol-disulfide interchange protein